MTTLRELIHNLQKLVEKHPDSGNLEVYTIHGASGVTHEIGTFNIVTKDDSYDAGPTCDLPDGTKFVSLYIGN